MLWLALARRFRSRVPVLGPCVTPFRVWPTDLDVLLHVNNGIYFSMMDVARFDLMARAGLMGEVRRRGWYPVVTAETIQFRRSLLPFQAFTIESRVIGWDDKAFVIEQRFLRPGEDRPVAQALVRAMFLSRRGGTVPIQEFLAVAPPQQRPVMPDYAARWNADHSAWRAS